MEDAGSRCCWLFEDVAGCRRVKVMGVETTLVVGLPRVADSDRDSTVVVVNVRVG